MTKRETIKNIIKVVISLVLLAGFYGFIASQEVVPMLFFWVIAEIFAFADGITVYNIVIYHTGSGSKRIERSRRSYHDFEDNQEEDDYVVSNVHRAVA